jgi:hypothetical protein
MIDAASPDRSSIPSMSKVSVAVLAPSGTAKLAVVISPGPSCSTSPKPTRLATVPPTNPPSPPEKSFDKSVATAIGGGTLRISKPDIWPAVSPDSASTPEISAITAMPMPTMPADRTTQSTVIAPVSSSMKSSDHADTSDAPHD